MGNNFFAAEWIARARAGVGPWLRLPQSAPLGTAFKNRRGVAAAEYAILSVGMVVVVGTAVVTLGNAMSGGFATAGSEIMNQQAMLSSGDPGGGGNIGGRGRGGMGGSGGVGSGNPLSGGVPVAGAEITNPRVVVHIDGIR